MINLDPDTQEINKHRKASKGIENRIDFRVIPQYLAMSIKIRKT